MRIRFRNKLFGFFFILVHGLLAGLICQVFVKEPVDRYIHIRNFRYGKDPYVIRCNRGDRLHLTFSTDDTGHSFFLAEFDVDAKVSPSTNDITVFKTSDPSDKPYLTKELLIVAEHPGILNYLIARSDYRCHVWCGPMHAFEQGKLVLLPNTLLWFGLGCIIGILLFGSLILFRSPRVVLPGPGRSEGKDLLAPSPFLRKMLLSRWPQILLTLLTLIMIYGVIMTSVFGTKVSGRNLGVLLMWAVWLFLLIAALTPLGGRIWCTICPLPMFGDLLQRNSFFAPIKGRTKQYYGKYSGLFLKWPERLNNNWTRLFVFLILATFSTTLVASPRFSGYTVLMLLLLPTAMALVWELRAFCRYICPVSAFISPFSGMSLLALRNKSQKVCDQCKPHYCEKGNAGGWACPYGINVGSLRENSSCGLCLECLRSCTYENVTLYIRPFAAERKIRNMGDAWLVQAIFTIAVVYSVLYLGPWPVVRDFVNILDKQNWDLFGIYALLLWSIVLLAVPGILFLLASLAKKASGIPEDTRSVFLDYTASLLPLGLLLWIAFVIPMLFVNITFVVQSFSDPFGWGWDFFGTANIPWHPFLSRYIPWFQTFGVLTGFYLSLRNLFRCWEEKASTSRVIFYGTLPLAVFLTLVAGGMLFFFAN